MSGTEGADEGDGSAADSSGVVTSEFEIEPFRGSERVVPWLALEVVRAGGVGADVKAVEVGGLRGEIAGLEEGVEYSVQVVIEEDLRMDIESAPVRFLAGDPVRLGVGVDPFVVVRATEPVDGWVSLLLRPQGGDSYGIPMREGVAVLSVRRLTDERRGVTAWGAGWSAIDAVEVDLTALFEVTDLPVRRDSNAVFVPVEGYLHRSVGLWRVRQGALAEQIREVPSAVDEPLVRREDEGLLFANIAPPFDVLLRNGDTFELVAVRSSTPGPVRTGAPEHEWSWTGADIVQQWGRRFGVPSGYGVHFEAYVRGLDRWMGFGMIHLHRPDMQILRRRGLVFRADGSDSIRLVLRDRDGTVIVREPIQAVAPADGR